MHAWLSGGQTKINLFLLRNQILKIFFHRVLAAWKIKTQQVNKHGNSIPPHIKL